MNCLRLNWTTKEHKIKKLKQNKFKQTERMYLFL